PGESIYEAVRRELKEETRLTNIEALKLCAVITIDISEKSGIVLFVFTAHSSSRQVRDSSEGKLEWVNWQSQPKEALVEDLPVFLPKILSLMPADPPIFAHYSYDKDRTLTIRFPP